MYWRKGFLKSLKATQREHWYQSFLMQAFASIGGLAPLWLGYLLCVVFDKSVKLVDLAGNGEFALYCAASVAPTLYLILHERSPNRLDGQAVLALIGIVILLVSVAIYAFIAPIPTRSIGQEVLNRETYAAATASLFLLGIGFSFLVGALDLSRTRPAVQEIAEREQRKLKEEIEEMGDDR